MRALTITPEQAAKVGHQVWRNETGGRRDDITAWNAAEDFASLGIGHFIWFPAGLKTRFKESFPSLLAFLQQRGADIPSWLDTSPAPPCPWTTRQDFKRNFHSAKMSGLRDMLHATVGLQAEYMALRMRAALPKMLATLTNDDDRRHVRQQFFRTARASPDLYPLIDYINFKGEGISPSETYPNIRTRAPEGWGLKHVLLAMSGTTSDPRSVLREFSAAASSTLLRRIRNNPPNKRWQRGWLARTDTYSRPLR